MPSLKRLDIKTDEVYVCSFSVDRTTVLTGAHGNPVQLWDVVSGRLLLDFGDPSVASWAVKWTDDRNVTFGARDGGVVIADGRTGHAIQALRGHTGFVRALDARQQMVISACGAGAEVMLWNVTKGQ